VKRVAFHLKNILNSGIGVVVFGLKKFGSSWIWWKILGIWKRKKMKKWDGFEEYARFRGMYLRY